jgi:hypothetical protein
MVVQLWQKLEGMADPTVHQETMTFLIILVAKSKST